MTRAISLHNVSKSYAKGVRVVERLSLDIDPGEFLVLLGPSGCGKSTVLRMIAGLEEIDEGELFLDGEWANDLPPSGRDMAMVFQNFALYPSMSSRDNISFPLRIEAPGEDPSPRVDATARMLGIEDLLDRLPAQLSGGERQRVAMGRAIARHPSAFLMDEPLSNLDAKLRNHLRAEITKLTRELGVTTIYVTHDQSEAMSLGDRVAVLRGGVLQQIGTPREVYALPRNVFVAAFIGTPRINLLRGVVRAPLDGAMTISLGKQFLRLPEPLSLDHQLLRVQQGREIIVGLRSEAVRIAKPTSARPGEVVLTGLVEHVEFQGHEMLVHFNTGSRPAVVPELEAPRPARRDRRRRREGGTVLDRIRERAGALRAGSSAVAVLDDPADAGEERPFEPVPPEGRLPGDLIVRTTPDLDLRHGMQVPLLVDIAHMFVFDQDGERICPAPARLPDLAE
ncbi:MULTISPECIES: ABC transporter ATP-binding protein [unclassified Streptomyces]|uniref:ABC transporter ATP-binding protein n=1 Tax=unclassified Streptomyces TaxID=2593676 RepID=UPI0007F52859|nr:MULTISPECIES: ABC transporter ATP-binding protein [unclassified Streptomyces]MCM1974230.1 ABC transporter ATP-binding protein [Streptomyces sp. G1]SBT95944.1 carbohydrate ABC transporter ATP-binding protein, CUT1 family [Streptomyces sp. DI166]